MKPFKSLTIGFLAILSATGYNLNAQNLADGLRFSQTINNGTARFVSMGGAFGALGADFSSIGVNPAGVGVYKSGEFTITPSFKTQKVNSTFLGISASESKNRLYLDNLGFVMSFKPYKSEEKGILAYNLSFGYNRTNDFHSNTITLGDFNKYSIMDYFSAITNGKYTPSQLEPSTNYNPFNSLGGGAWESIMAWNTWLLYEYDSGTGTYEPAIYLQDSVNYKNIVTTEGGSGEFTTAFGVNISNKLHLGASLGITDFNYTFNSTYSEDAKPTNPSWPNGDRFYYMDYKHYFETKGSGYNLKIGGIYIPIPEVRLGLSLHTPTFYNFDDAYSSSIITNFDTTGTEVNFQSNSPLGRYDYHFETPMKVIGSVAFVFMQKGLISIDVEHLDYSAMRFRRGGDGDAFWDLNSQMDNTFKSVTNLRFGGEYKLGDISLRGGYAYYPSPYKSGFLNDKSNIRQFSGGIGYRSGNVSIDFAYLRTLQDIKYVFYDFNIPSVTNKVRDSRLLLTFGFRF
ncbi:MAG TPA: hypothetical protein ENN49_05735 [Bacteroidales bacterium]|nr:hypothetical protein [Bacteroidales bacterium]